MVVLQRSREWSRDSIAFKRLRGPVRLWQAFWAREVVLTPSPGRGVITVPRTACWRFTGFCSLSGRRSLTFIGDVSWHYFAPCFVFKLTLFGAIAFCRRANLICFALWIARGGNRQRRRRLAISPASQHCRPLTDGFLVNFEGRGALHVATPCDVSNQSSCFPPHSPNLHASTPQPWKQQQVIPKEPLLKCLEPSGHASICWEPCSDLPITSCSRTRALEGLGSASLRATRVCHNNVSEKCFLSL